MKKSILVIAVMAMCSPAYAQLGGLGGALRKAQQVQDTKKKIDDLTFTEDEEQTIGSDVSLKVRQRFGVVQDPAVHKYVSLVGTTLAKASDRPDLPWTFIVLDTDGVNAFASPGGFVHITRGALGLISNEAELAGVLGHEIGHVVRKHTLNALRKNSAVSLGASAASSRSSLLASVGSRVYENVLENAYDRGDELDADRLGVELPAKVGYKADSIGTFLQRLDDRNKDQAEKNGLFASHPDTKERIDKIKSQSASLKASATVEPRYKSNIKYEVPALTAIAVVADGASGLAGSTKPAEKQEEPKKKGFGLGSLKQTVAPEKQSSQVSASGGARGVGPDRAAKGGSNPALVKTAVSVAELGEFKKGIA
ncbi:MAG TPA: M48 family metalloprotease [Vicinamibacterales bacterium]|nr:M48 family metalloprotease [Vicinamibacterales bacterium]